VGISGDLAVNAGSEGNDQWLSGLNIGQNSYFYTLN
jgi:hypothetical protein